MEEPEAAASIAADNGLGGGGAKLVVVLLSDLEDGEEGAEPGREEEERWHCQCVMPPTSGDMIRGSRKWANSEDSIRCDNGSTPASNRSFTK